MTGRGGDERADSLPASARARRLRAWPLPAGPLIAGLALTGACEGLLSPRHAVHKVGDFCSHTLYTSFIVLAALTILWRAWRGREPRLFWWPPAVGLATVLCVESLKRLTRFPRPDGDPNGFPSGHTTFAFALAWLLCRLSPRLAPLWYAVAVFIGWSRVEGQAHFVYQVLCGAVFGTLIGWAIGAIRRDGPTGTSLPASRGLS